MEKWLPQSECSRDRRVNKTSLGLVALALAVSCARAPEPTAQHPVPARAPFDLNCPDDQTRYRRLDPNTWGAVGCGRQATYIKVCKQKATAIEWHFETECQWVLNAAGK